MLLLVAICVSCSFSYTEYRPKYLLPFNNTTIKLGENRYEKYVNIESKDKLKELDITNCMLLFQWHN